MNPQMIQRIHGVVGGVLLMRATDSFVGCVSVMVSPVGDLSARAFGVLPALVAFAFSAIFGVLYLRGEVQRWVHWLMIALLGVGTIFSTFSAVLPFITEVKIGGVRGTMLASAATRLLIAGGLIWCVAKLLRERKKEPNSVGSAAPQRAAGPRLNKPGSSED